jgi:RHS repeat-associated protein
MDTEESCATGQARDGVKVMSLDGGTQYEMVGGYARGDVWSQWWNGSELSGVTGLSLRWATDDGNCYPQELDGTCSNACPQSAGSGPQHSGFVIREYEYQRYEAGADSYFPPLRFPGQYWDAETDLYENWHRYFWPHGGRYLAPEPLLHDPIQLRRSAKEGHDMPTYAYVGNNPVRYTDPTGLIRVDMGSMKSCFGDGYGVAWSDVYKKVQEAAERPSCRLFFWNAYGADISQLVTNGEGVRISFDYLSGHSRLVRLITDPRGVESASGIKIDCRHFTLDSAEAIARTVLHEMAHRARRDASECRADPWKGRIDLHDRADEVDEECFE